MSSSWEETVAAFKAIQLRQPPSDAAARLRLLRDGRGYPNEAPYVIGGLTSEEARALLIWGLSGEPAIAQGCAYVAVMAVHGFPVGNGVAAQMSQGQVRTVRRHLTDQDAEVVIAEARKTSPALSEYIDSRIAWWASLPSRATNWERR